MTRPADAFALCKLFPVGHANEAEAEKLYRRVFQRMDRFNRDAQKYASTHASLRRKCREDVLPEGNVQNVPPAVRRTLILFGVADSLALHFQRRTLWTLRILMFLVLTAAICFQLYSYVQPKPLALAIGYLAALLAAYLVYLHARCAEIFTIATSIIAPWLKGCEYISSGAGRAANQRV